MRQAGLTILGRSPGSLTVGLAQLTAAHAHARYSSMGGAPSATPAAKKAPNIAVMCAVVLAKK